MNGHFCISIVCVKILLLCQYFYPENFSINDVAWGLSALGHDVLVVTGQPNYGHNQIYEGYEHVVDEVIRGVRVHRCPLKPRKQNRFSIIENYLSFWKSSKRYLKHLKEEFDVVYSMSLSPVISISGGTLYARKHHVRHVLHCLDLWPESPVVTGAVKKDSILYRLLFRWSKKIYENVDEILISSPSFRDYFDEVLGVKNVPICYVPQPPIVTPASEEPVTFTHKVNFVYAGNIGTLQLVENLVEAVRYAREQIDVCLHVIGMGARVDAVNELVKRYGLEENVCFYGVKPRDVTAAFYERATAIMVPLTNKGTVGKTIPAKLTTALYYGKPILGVIEGDGRAILEDSGGAIFADDETPEAIAKAMCALGKMSEEERESLGDKNRAYYDSHYGDERIVNEILNHLKNR